VVPRHSADQRVNRVRRARLATPSHRILLSAAICAEFPGGLPNYGGEGFRRKGIVVKSCTLGEGQPRRNRDEEAARLSLHPRFSGMKPADLARCAIEMRVAACRTTPTDHSPVPGIGSWIAPCNRKHRGNREFSQILQFRAKCHSGTVDKSRDTLIRNCRRTSQRLMRVRTPATSSAIPAELSECGRSVREDRNYR